jgi:hypothetical protein
MAMANLSSDETVGKVAKWQREFASSASLKGVGGVVKGKERDHLVLEILPDYLNQGIDIIESLTHILGVHQGNASS